MDGHLHPQQPGVAATSSFGSPFRTMTACDSQGSCVAPVAAADSLALRLSAAQLSNGSSRNTAGRAPCLLPPPASTAAAALHWGGPTAATRSGGAQLQGPAAGGASFGGPWGPAATASAAATATTGFPASTTATTAATATAATATATATTGFPALHPNAYTNARQQHRDFRCTPPEATNASRAAAAGEEEDAASSFLAASSSSRPSFPGSAASPAIQQQPMSVAYDLPCAGGVGAVAPLVASGVQAGYVRFLVEGQSPERMRKSPAVVDLQAPPGYEYADLSVVSPSLEARPAAEQELLIQEFTARSAIGVGGGGPAAGGAAASSIPAGLCVHSPSPQAPDDLGKRRSATLSPPTQTMRDKTTGRKTKSHQSAFDPPSPVDSAASAPSMSFSAEGGREGIVSVPRADTLENKTGNNLLQVDGGTLSIQKLQGEVQSFVSIMYDSVFNTSPTWQVPLYASSGRGLHTLQLSDVVISMHSPWCTRKQWLDPQLFGGRPLEHPLFDQGSGHADALRQLTALKACIGDFAVTVECVQACVAGAGRLSCALRGTLVAPGISSCDTDVSSEAGREGARPPQAPKVGRFAHFLTLIPKPLTDEQPADSAVEGPRKNVAVDSRPWLLVARRLYFLIESEMFLAINAPEGGGGAAAAAAAAVAAPSSPQVVGGQALLYDGDLSLGVPKGPEAPLRLQTGRNAMHVGSLQELADPRATAKRTPPLNSLSQVLKSAIALGHDRAVSLSGKTRGTAASHPSRGDISTSADCMEAAVAQLATGLLADSPTRSPQQMVTDAASWTALLQNPAQRQRRSRKKKKSARQGGANASSADPDTSQFLAGNGLTSAAAAQSASFQLQGVLQQQQYEQKCLQDRRDDLLSISPLASKGILALPASQGVPPDAFERAVFVSWIPRAARAQEYRDKEEAENRLKSVLSNKMGIRGIERVSVFPPRGSHCCITFYNSEASTAFLLAYAGGTFTAKTELFKQRICASFNVDVDRGIQRVFIRIEGVKLMPPTGRAVDPEPKS